jgi:ribonuclease D
MTAPSSPPQPLATAREIEQLVRAARDEGRVAIDTEFHWERTYAPILCLLQAATRDRLVLVDPLAAGDVRPIDELVADPQVQLVMHAPAADLGLFAMREDTRATRVFDTQVAAGFVGLGSGLSLTRLVRGALGVVLEHDETFSDWRRRPLTDTQLAYAADDVRYLLPLADEIERRLHDMGRERWAADELHRRYGNPEAIVSDPEEAWRRVQRRGRLNARQLAVLRELAAWREREARRRDRPVGWIVRDASLIELARAQPATPDSVKRIRGLESARAPDLEGLADAVKRGREAEPVRLPREPGGELGHRIAVGSALASVLLRARCEGAGLAPELVASRADLEDLVRSLLAGSADGHPLVTGWRAELVGDELRELVAGRIALAARADPPHVVTMPLTGTDGPAA